MDFLLIILSLNDLLTKTKSKNAIISVVGLGRVGLPLSSVLANSGFNVIGIDINSEKLASIKNAICPFFDPSLQENLKKSIGSGLFTVSKNIPNDIDVIFLTVGTPASSEGSAD